MRCLALAVVLKERSGLFIEKGSTFGTGCGYAFLTDEELKQLLQL